MESKYFKSNSKGFEEPKLHLHPITKPISRRRHSSVEEVIRNININEGFLKDTHTLGRMESGFSYLKNLVSNLKTPNHTQDYSLDSVIKILCLKENVEYEEQQVFLKSK
jgi:hypothetical protein